MTRHGFTGRAASPGTAVGVLHRVDRPQQSTADDAAAGDPAARLTEAFETVGAQLLTTAKKLRADDQTEQAEILEVIGYLAADTDLRALALQYANDGHSVLQAVQNASAHPNTTRARAANRGRAASPAQRDNSTRSSPDSTISTARGP